MSVLQKIADIENEVHTVHFVCKLSIHFRWYNENGIDKKTPPIVDGSDAEE